MKRNLAFLTAGLLLSASPALGAWPTPTQKTTALYASGSTIVTSSISIAAGHLAVIQGIVRGNTISSVADNSGGGNVWTLLTPCQRGANSDYSWTAYSVLTAPLSSNTITATLGGSATGGALVVWDVTGQAASPADAVGCNFNNSAVTNPTVTSGAPAASGNIFFAGYAIPSTTAGFTLTPNGSWSTPYATGNTTVGIYSMWLDATGSGAAQTASPTAGTAKAYTFHMASFKINASPAAVCTRSLLGVGC